MATTGRRVTSARERAAADNVVTDVIVHSECRADARLERLSYPEIEFSAVIADGHVSGQPHAVFFR